MEFVTLGRTGLRASVAGLGSGGLSKLGRSRDRGDENAVAVVRRALELGVNVIDTAECYGTEEAIGRAVRDFRRERIVLATKRSTWVDDWTEVDSALDASLARLGTDYVDVYQLHGLSLDKYERAVAEVLPRLERLREQGKLRFIGVTEAFGGDTRHSMLARALEDDCWDTVMVGFNVLNQTARDAVARLREVVAELKAKNLVPEELDDDDPLGWLVREGGAESVVDAAYRFARHEPGVHTVLFGTGNVRHVEENVRSLGRPPLPAGDVEKLKRMFAGVDCVTGG
jgi:aryl-alcohol dehydrogenase-like predicted oxidoreductase